MKDFSTSPSATAITLHPAFRTRFGIAGVLMAGAGLPGLRPDDAKSQSEPIALPQCSRDMRAMWDQIGSAARAEPAGGMLSLVGDVNGRCAMEARRSFHHQVGSGQVYHSSEVGP